MLDKSMLLIFRINSVEKFKNIPLKYLTILNKNVIIAR